MVAPPGADSSGTPAPLCGYDSPISCRSHLRLEGFQPCLVGAWVSFVFLYLSLRLPFKRGLESRYRLWILELQPANTSFFSRSDHAKFLHSLCNLSGHEQPASDCRTKSGDEGRYRRKLGRVFSDEFNGR